MAQWYYTQNGQQAGPVDEAQLKGLIGSGQVGAQDMVWKDGMAAWQPASTVPELAGGGAAPAPTYSAPQQYAQPQQYGAPQGQPLNYGGYPQQQNYPSGSVPNYLVQSILVTVLCCWPLGIPAIVFAAQVNSKLAIGDYAGAVESSNKAKMFSWISFGLGVALIVISFITVMAGGMSSRY